MKIYVKLLNLQNSLHFLFPYKQIKKNFPYFSWLEVDQNFFRTFPDSVASPSYFCTVLTSTFCTLFV